MKFVKLLTLFILSFAVCSCTDGSIDDAAQSKEGTTIKATIPSLAGVTRATIKDEFDDYLEEGGLTFMWAKGDTFTVTDAASNSVTFLYKSIEGSDKSVATFQCSDNTFEFVEGEKYIATFGAETTNEYSTIGNNANALNQSIYMEAEIESYSSDSAFEFVSKSAVMCLNFNVGFKPATLTYKDEENNITVDYSAIESSATVGANYAYFALKPLASGVSRQVRVKLTTQDDKEFNYSAATTAGYVAGEYYVSSIELTRDGVKDPFGYGSEFFYEDYMLPGKKGACFTLKEATAHKTIARIQELNCFWNYSWSLGLNEHQPDDVEFLPMIWGGGNASDANISKVQGYIDQGRVKHVLGFNEPDKSDQSNMSVEKAIELWPKLESLGVPLGSPAPAQAEGSWLDEFMEEALKRGYRIDYICVHDYGGGSSSAFLNKLARLYKKYKRPLLITEFAVADWGATSVEDNIHSPAKVLKFMKEVLPAMEELDYVLGYSWFHFGVTQKQGWSSALIGADGELTELGRYYRDFNATK